MRANVSSFFLIGFALACLAAEAQMGGGQRRSRLEGRPAQERPESGPQAARAMDPVFALERELPSLRADLKLDEGQGKLWGPFERSLRDAAELTRQRTRRLMTPRPADAPVPNALGVVEALAGEERLRADAMAEAASRLKALYVGLAPAQRSLFDRRVLLSQSEPLGAP